MTSKNSNLPCNPKFTEAEALAERQTIAALRKEAREARDKNNALVDDIWRKDPVLNKGLSSEAQAVLDKERQSLLDSLAEHQYAERYEALIQEIRTREIALYGESDVGDSSIPFEL